MADLEQLSDDELIHRMRAGAEQAFTALYRRHQSAVFRFAVHMSGSEQLAEEVTQEAFLSLIREGARYDPERGPLSAYLLGIARKQVLRWLERDRIYVRLTGEEGESMEDLSDGRDLLVEINRNRSVASLRSAVLALPPTYREVVVLCDLQELDYSEAASIVGCPVGTIRSRLHRARALLFEKMRLMAGVGPSVVK